MRHSISCPTPERPTPTEPAASSRLRTVTGNRFPRKCACGCGLGIPRDPEIRYVVDFGAAGPCHAYLREHSHDYESNRRHARNTEEDNSVSRLVAASSLPHEYAATHTVGSPPTMIRGRYAKDYRSRSRGCEFGSV
jgi:hypothetical protein